MLPEAEDDGLLGFGEVLEPFWVVGGAVAS